MNRRFSLTLLASAVGFLAGVANAQTPITGAAPPAFKAPLTPDGQPDLQGYWTNDTYTPLERPAAFADKEFFTAEEAAAFLKSRDDRLNGQSATDIHYDDAI